jgi:manganese-dependent ADP-ribose/CDP-alcohol diphosphatase
MRFTIVILFAILVSYIMPENVSTWNPHSEKQDQTPLFSFGLIADIQYCNCDPEGTRFYRSSLVKLKEAVKYFRKSKPSFVVNLGDMIDKDFASYKPVFNILDTAGFKIYHITGNHDYSVEPRLKKRLPPLQFNNEGYFSFINGKFRFIFLNGNEVSTYATNKKSVIKEANDSILKLKNNGELNGMEWNGGISRKQILWLTNQLNTAANNSEKVFIMCHFPVYPVNIHNLLNYKDILHVLEGYDNIIAWFNGHNHYGNYGNSHMVHFVTMKGMVETENSNSFALVEVYKNKIWIKGSGREKSQILAY